ncbi:prophage regulatory protein [Paraburkholderia sp. GAS41]|uniref:helix-turn-helix transcriptional regulator n=1 Tax=Paraburkholderia sp. GAS41 TaxID=3035134 RepID=UPI003D200A38
MKDIENRTPNALLRRAQVEKDTGLSIRTIYRRIADRTFPAPVQIGPKSVGWRVCDIDAWLVDPAAYKAA